MKVVLRKPPQRTAYMWPGHPAPPDLGQGIKVRAYIAGRNGSTQKCRDCGRPDYEHGYVDSLAGSVVRVCPGSYIVAVDGVPIEALKPEEFEKRYAPENPAVPVHP